MEILAPQENLQHGLVSVEIPELGEASRGKVRDWWDLDQERRVIVTTDRTSAFDRVICTVPGKGEVLNRLSAFWLFNFSNVDHINTHIIALPHPNVSIVRTAVETLPVEIILRACMARSSTSTSVYRNYQNGDRIIYGINFPDGLAANQYFPADLGRNGVIVTPTTKAEAGAHDEMLETEEAKELVDSRFGNGTWRKAEDIAYKMFARGAKRFQNAGLILVDTKYEFGIDRRGDLMVIDEVHTPDSSRIWRSDNYLQRVAEGVEPELYDKEALRRHLSGDLGYRGDGEVPIVSKEVIQAMSDAYRVPFERITGMKIKSYATTSEQIRLSLRPFLAA